MTVQNRYKPIVKSRAASTDTTIIVDGLPTDTSITSGYMTAKTSKGKFIEEIKFTGTNTVGSTYTLTGCLRGLREYGSDVEVTANKKPLPAGTILVMGPNQNIENNEAKLDAPNTFTGDQTINAGNVNLDDTYGLSSDSDNIRIYRDGDDWKFVDNNQAVRTLSQLASLSGSNDKIKISAVDTTEGYGAAKLLGGDGISATDSGAGNSTLTFAVDLATNPGLEFSTGKLKVDIVPNVGLELVASGLGVVAPNVSQNTAGENVDGTSTPQATYISYGTGGRTAGRYYKSDNNDFTNDADNFFGFSEENVTTGNAGELISGGLVSGFSGLTAGKNVYMSDTAGAVTQTIPSATFSQKIGVAKSATTLYIDKGPKIYTTSIVNTRTLTEGTGNVDTAIDVGWAIRMIKVTVYAFAAGAGTADNERAMASFTVSNTTALGGAQFNDDNGTPEAIELAGASTSQISGGGATYMSVTASLQSITERTFTARSAFVKTGAATGTEESKVRMVIEVYGY